VSPAGVFSLSSRSFLTKEKDKEERRKMEWHLFRLHPIEGTGAVK
jgi:hypothetical protein